MNTLDQNQTNASAPVFTVASLSALVDAATKSLIKSDSALVAVQDSVRSIVSGNKINTVDALIVCEVITRFEKEHAHADSGERANRIRAMFKQPIERETKDRYTFKKQAGVWALVKKVKRTESDKAASAEAVAPAIKAGNPEAQAASLSLDAVLAYVEQNRSNAEFLAALQATLAGG